MRDRGEDNCLFRLLARGAIVSLYPFPTFPFLLFFHVKRETAPCQKRRIKSLRRPPLGLSRFFFGLCVCVFVSGLCARVAGDDDDDVCLWCCRRPHSSQTEAGAKRSLKSWERRRPSPPPPPKEGKKKKKTWYRKKGKKSGAEKLFAPFTLSLCPPPPLPLSPLSPP